MIVRHLRKLSVFKHQKASPFSNTVATSRRFHNHGDYQGVFPCVVRKGLIQARRPVFENTSIHAPAHQTSNNHTSYYEKILKRLAYILQSPADAQQPHETNLLEKCARYAEVAEIAQTTVEAPSKSTKIGYTTGRKYRRFIGDQRPAHAPKLCKKKKKESPPCDLIKDECKGKKGAKGKKKSKTGGDDPCAKKKKKKDPCAKKKKDPCGDKGGKKKDPCAKKKDPCAKKKEKGPCGDNGGKKKKDPCAKKKKDSCAKKKKDSCAKKKKDPCGKKKEDPCKKKKSDPCKKKKDDPCKKKKEDSCE